MVILGLIIGGLLLALMGALLWVFIDFRKYKKNNHLVFLLLLLCPASLFAQLTDKDDSTISHTVFGRNIFTSHELSFEPNMNLATPENYVLGPGDEVIIN